MTLNAPKIDRRQFAATSAIVLLARNASADQTSIPPTTGTASGDWIVHTDVPANREVPLPKLIESWVTPVDRFYVRSHAANPEVDPATFRLKIGGMVDADVELSLQDLTENFESIDVTATMTCAGNRRYEHSKTRQISGVPWREGAIGNATWTGVRLSDVLNDVGVNPAAEHVWFDGLDRIEYDGQTIGFGASIPIQKAMENDDWGGAGALLCTTMNGQPLTPDHGAPLRTVVPGYIGARSVKWLGSMTLADRPNPNHYQSTAYKIVREGTPIEWAEKAPIYRFAINSVVCDVRPGERTEVKGYALPPGDPGSVIERVELSIDGGRGWIAAELVGPARPLCWRLWRASMEIPEGTASLLVRAIDNRGVTQPPGSPWNRKGYMYNAWQRVDLG